MIKRLQRIYFLGAGLTGEKKGKKRFEFQNLRLFFRCFFETLYPFKKTEQKSQGPLFQKNSSFRTDFLATVAAYALIIVADG